MMELFLGVFFILDRIVIIYIVLGVGLINGLMEGWMYKYLLGVLDNMFCCS